ncbi:MAG: Uma2 family endonuclease [Gordonia amarae]
MTVQINLPPTGVRSRTDFDNLPEVSPGWAWELRSGRLELTLMPVTFWHFRIVMMVLEHWLRLGHEVAGEQYVADSGFARGETGRNNFVADGVVFEQGYRPAKNSTTHDAANIHTVIEAVSAGSEDRDAVDKVRVYAALGIPNYWIIRGDADSDDIDGFITMYRLVDGDYQVVGNRLVSQLAATD